ncbi:MAG: F0F1 ATP synthase subunit delta [Patescibacteria group bacterium]
MGKKTSDTQLAQALWQFTHDALPEEIEERVAGFTHYLASNNLLHRGERIAASFSDVALKAEGKERLIIETPYSLSEQVIKDIQHALDLATAEVEVRENPALLGGIIARTKDRVFDASMTSQLHKLAKTLVE